MFSYRLFQELAWLTDTRNTELRCFLSELPEFLPGSVTAHSYRNRKPWLHSRSFRSREG